MVLDAYSPCPCGSGKKFKWCCQPIHADIDRAFRQDAEGQHEAALKILQEVVAANPANPEAHGRYAQLLYQNDRVEDAENALGKAFEINPNYAFGHLLRGMFRLYEGEYVGALLQFRKAADLYDPQALDQLGQTYAMIADCEMKLGRPVAVRAALQIALRCQPDYQELRQNFDAAFGPQSLLPMSARREYTLISPPASEPVREQARSQDSRSPAWQKALGAAASTRLGDVGRAFEQLTRDLGDAKSPEAAAAWYNLGLARAWLGENRTALEALDRYVEMESDEPKAVQAAALGEVLRMGQGMEEESDYRDYAVTYRVRDPNVVVGLLQEWEREGRLLGTQVSQEQGVLSTLVMEKLPVLMAGTKPPLKLLSYLLLAGPELRINHPVKESVDKVRAELEQRAGQGLMPGQERTGRGSFRDAVIEALVFPVGVGDQALAEARIREHAERFFEDTWIHRPLRSLNRIPPVDAAGHRVLRKKLLGVIQFLQECAAGGVLKVYDFDRLRRRLGVLDGAVPAAPAAATGGAGDIGAMSASELAALQIEQLSEAQLEQARQSAAKLDAQDMALNFGRALVGRPRAAADGATPFDRGPTYFYLVQRALAEGNTDEALRLVNEGEQDDREHNGGRRQADFELRRAQVHVRRREADQAFEVYEKLLQSDPANMKARGSAVEAMLSLKQGPRALKLAEEGLTKARQANDRDNEQYFLELVSAAKKAGG